MTAIVEAGPRVVIEAHPSGTEVAVVSLPAGAVARVHHPSGVREYPADVDSPVLVVPGDRETIGWGWSEGRYGSPRGLRNSRHKLNRDAWDAAAQAVELGAEVVYVQYEQIDYYGKPQWAAVGIREAGETRG